VISLANKSEESVEKTERTEKTVQPAFSKKKLLGSKKYKNQRDVLNVILDNDQKYTLNGVDDLIQKFNKMKG
jgi:hypothetical protein